MTNRSLWLDEAALSLNIIKLQIPDFIHQPLAYYHQAAPFGFLAVEKIFTFMSGTSEFILRLLPLLCSIISLWLFWQMAKIYLLESYVSIAVLCFAILPSLIYYSSEVKPYAIDVFFTLISYVYIAPALLNKINLSKAILLATLGALSIWFSFPVLFILSGIGITVLIRSSIQKDWPKLSLIGGILFTWFISFLIGKTVLFNQISLTISKNQIWQNGYINFTKPTSLFPIFKNVLIYPLGFTNHPWLAGLLFIAGAYYLFQEDKKKFFFLLLPLIFVLLASSFHNYSCKDRLALFLIPIFLIFIIKGISTLTLKTGPYKIVIIPLFLGILFYSSISITWINFTQPKGREEIKTLLYFVKDHLKPNDIIYISDRSIPAFEYYEPRFNSPSDHYLKENTEHSHILSIFKDLKELSHFNRVWVVFSHYYNGGNINADFLVKNLWRFNGKLIGNYTCPNNNYSLGARVYLFDLSNFSVPTNI